MELKSKTQRGGGGGGGVTYKVLYWEALFNSCIGLFQVSCER